jgi:hydrogenase 3 maturation protease
LSDDVLEAGLAAIRSRNWLLLGVGNDMRGDDAFGPLLARRLHVLGMPSLDGGTAPENVTGPIRRAAPEILLIADAVELGESPGTLRLLAPIDLEDGASSTHDPSLRILHRYLAAELTLETRVLAAQPASRGLGDPVSFEVLRSIDRIATILAGT